MSQVAFMFYDKSFGPHKGLSFCKDIRHCSVIASDGTNYILTHLNSEGINSKKLNFKNIESFVKKMQSSVPSLTAVIIVDMDGRRKKLWSPIIINSCNEVSRLVSGIGVGPTLNANHFHYTITRLDGERNYKITYSWRR